MRDVRQSSWVSARWFALALALIAACGGSDDDRPELNPCERMRDHLVDLQLADATGIDRDAHRDVMKRALGDDFIASCKSSMTKSQVSCALNASDAGAAAACVEQPNRN